MTNAEKRTNMTKAEKRAEITKLTAEITILARSIRRMHDKGSFKYYGKMVDNLAEKRFTVNKLAGLKVYKSLSEF